MKRAGWLLIASVAACGGAAEAPSQTPAGASAAPTSPESAGQRNESTPEAVVSARSEVDRAEQRISAAQSDCAEACRALASMERAAEHLCALDSGAECTHVRERVEAARERVRSTCGECSR
ncbi:MAG TPA: hypothetical protein VGH28_25210 [Polyangiaceae bacterium]|jgi:hypothetical protein